MSDTHAETTQTIAFVRTTDVPQSPPPVTETGLIKWVRENLFSSVLNSILSIVSIVFVLFVTYEIFPWFWNSTWNANSLTECRESGTGACFGVIKERWQQLMFGFYPSDGYWRPVLTFVLLFPAMAPILFNGLPRSTLIFSGLFPFLGYWLIWGGSLWGPISGLMGFAAAFFVYRAVLKRSASLALLGAVAALLIWMLLIAGPVANVLGAAIPLDLESVNSRDIGGFLLTLILGITCIALALPLGVLLALGRQSDLIIIKYICVGFIEFIRGVPLITLLFVANVMLAYFLPPSTSFDLILRVVIMVTAFAAAYLAEVIRGGLAALPRGQYEAADSLGLDYWQAMQLIILPQALKISIPSIVNVFIGLYKDTTLVSIISMYDPLGLTNAIRADANWNGIIWELYGFVALFFFISCYAMSRYSQYLEQKLNNDHR